MTFSFKTFMAASLVTLALNGCQPVALPSTSGAATAPSAITEVMIKAHDFSYDAPQQIEAGWVALTLENMGVEPHHAQVARLHDGVTSEQFLAALKQGEGPALALISFKGGPGVVDAKGQQQVTIELEPGNYFLLCFVPSRDGRTRSRRQKHRAAAA